MTMRRTIKAEPVRPPASRPQKNRPRYGTLSYVLVGIAPKDKGKKG